MPKAQRSRACTQCRERRVKCDETPEFCNQCRRLGLQCSGPIIGSVIIDMTDRVTKPRARKKKALIKSNVVVPILEDKDNAQALSTRKDSTLSTTSELYGSETSPHNESSATTPGSTVLPPEAERALATIRYQYRTPVLYQPSRIQGEALDIAFLRYFVEMNQNAQSSVVERPWLAQLPMIHSKAIKPAMKLSLRAASMAFFAKIHRDPAILVDSYRWYTASLNAQRMSLARLNDQARIPDKEELLVPIILGLYEVYAGTTSTSVLFHLQAACEIVKMRGPENCKTGVVWLLFKAMRASDAQKALVFNKPSFFASPDWVTIPFRGMPRDAYQDLTDIALQVPTCTSLCHVPGNLHTFFNSPFSPNVSLEPCRKRTKELIKNLDDWAAAYPYLATLSTGQNIVAADSMNSSVSSVKPASSCSSPDAVIPENFVAVNVVTFESVKLILVLLLRKLDTQDPALLQNPSKSQSPTSKALFDQAVRSADIVVKVAGYMSANKTVGFDFIRSVTPIVMVAILGPTEGVQKRALALLKRWGDERGMDGLVSAWMHV